MVKYRVPDQFKQGFVVISGLSDEQIDLLCAEVERASSSFSVESFVSELNKRVTIPVEDLRDLLHTIFSLTGFLIDGQIKIDELATDMADSYEEVNNEFTGEQKDRFKSNLTNIIRGTPRIKLIIKARELTNDYERVFSESKILSDTRFVFGDDLQERGQSAIIIHQLKIDYHQNGNPKQAFFAMDTNDLRKLKKSIDRALEKDEKIRSGHYFSNINFLELSS